MSAWLIAPVGAAVALLFAFIQGRNSTRNANRAREADAYETHLQEIADAARARNAVRFDGLPDDKYRRD